MKKVTWDVQYTSVPHVIKYCKKCSKKMEFVCSNKFRVNAERKYLDIWLIYKCSECNTTWNLTIYSRINPSSIPKAMLEGFHSNSEELAEKYAMNTELIGRNGVEVGMPDYKIVGQNIDFKEKVELHINTIYENKIKIGTIIRQKLEISQSVFEKLISNGSIKGLKEEDLKKSKLEKETILIIDMCL